MAMGERPGPAQRLRFLALGDSYTIGEGVAADERWPAQLSAMLRVRGLPLDDPEIVAATGWTTDELAEGIRRAAPAGPFELVSLLIGVNNQYRGRPLGEYREQFRGLVATAVALADGEPGRVMVLSVPDWGVTPFAEGRDRAAVASAIDAFNEAARAETQAAGAAYIDITPSSRAARSDPGLLAGDGLHPSGGMYRMWAELAAPAALAALAWRASAR